MGLDLGQPDFCSYLNALTSLRNECQIDKWLKELFSSLTFGIYPKVLGGIQQHLLILFCRLGEYLAYEERKLIIVGRVVNFYSAGCEQAFTWNLKRNWFSFDQMNLFLFLNYLLIFILGA